MNDRPVGYISQPTRRQVREEVQRCRDDNKPFDREAIRRQLGFGLLDAVRNGLLRR